ncbi:hypothetical protein GO613_15905 [Azoarcus communis]|uniref:Chemoreceptor zinc-binding domain-containing protein n=1 Tax=Parazoarcus communis SWub3 = DSM 12120 TaxID=1121029 RepID=A0A323V2I2_9RHOO|nr:CZB domain-containing protein [Parazoarcus communis]NMG49581.1 hypothetical protein [Parazoarcus communis]NMG68575.1 hypothetical protein [Parazoarcus communis SWub3 = DSM 12120]PZA17716.1 hypothetical protein DNK49_04075 [Azoarcus communis] [Parazoarcus communis SWub3 = DSM 12120]
MAQGAFFLQRLNDHIRYLNNIEATLAGRGDFTGCPHTACKLGSWMHGTGMQEVATCGDDATNIFKQLFGPHEAFHEASHRALALKEKGDLEGAEQAVTEMHRLSFQLVNLLIELDKAGTQSSRSPK